MQAQHLPSPRRLVALSGLFPNGEVEILAGCGHYPWIEQPERFAVAVEGFLREDSHL